MDIEKAAQYRSFYEVAKKITNPESRLAFYDALDSYRFDGVIPESLPLEADIAFTAVKPIIDADISRKNGGAPKHNTNAKKAESTEPAAEEEPKTKRFQKPTVDEVKAYCSERGNNVNAEHFVDFYESKGWKVGNAPMKDWKCAVRTWEQRSNMPKASSARELPADRLTL